MKLLKIICMPLMVIYSCSNSKPDFDLTPQKYNENVNTEIAYGITTDNNPDDNLIFSKCNSFSYKYFVEKEGKRYMSKLLETEENGRFDFWSSYELIESDKTNGESIVERFLMFTPVEIPQNGSIAPTQSLIKSYWIKNDGKLLFDMNEGIVENYKNIWMHPLRSLHMWPTFTAPWPYVDYPLEIGKKYNWWKKLGGGWGSDKYVQWDSIVHFDYVYEVIDKEIIEVKNKDVECFVIHAEGKSPIGNTQVVYHFNPILGFVKMDYQLMDESRIVLYLDDFELDCDITPEIPNFE